MTKKTGVVIALVAIWLAACGSKKDSAPSQPDLAACTPREAPGPNGVYESAALPTGACTATDPCALEVLEACPCGGKSAPTRVVCTCTDGQWNCVTYSTPPECGCGDAGK